MPQDHDFTITDFAGFRKYMDECLDSMEQRFADDEVPHAFTTWFSTLAETAIQANEVDARLIAKFADEYHKQVIKCGGAE